MEARGACLAALVEPLIDDAETIAALAEVIDTTLV
jgi:nitric oxide reductase NorQ protein